MKIKLEKKFVQLGLTIFLTALAIMAAYFLFFRLGEIKAAISRLNNILAPVYWGLVLAYIMTPLLNTIERNILFPAFNKIKFIKNETKKRKLIRGISITITLLIFIFFVYLFFSALIPQVYSSIESIIKNYNRYTNNLVNWLNKIMDNNPEIASFISNRLVDYSSEADDYLTVSVIPMFENLLLPNVKEYIQNFSASILRVVKLLYSLIIGIIISIYVLSGKEKFASQSCKLCYAFFERSNANKFIDSMRFTHRTFIGFLSGKVLDSIIIGIICYILALILKLPYPVLIGVIVGVTNIIPFFGPYFGAIPSALIILMVDPKKVLPFIIMILILQQFDGNILGPKILSESTGLSSFWIIFSITLFGGLFGVIGMIIGVPFMAVIITGINTLTNSRLERRELPTDASNYFEVGQINEEGIFSHYEAPKKTQKENNNFIKKLTICFCKIKKCIVDKIKKK